MNLTTPTDQQDAYEWASVLLAHGFIGLALVAAVAWASGRMWLSFWIVSAVYLICWEGGVQRFGAGGVDALVDTFAVMAGGLAGIAAWGRKGGAVAAALTLMAWVLAGGIWRRR